MMVRLRFTAVSDTSAKKKETLSSQPVGDGDESGVGELFPHGALNPGVESSICRGWQMSRRKPRTRELGAPREAVDSSKMMSRESRKSLQRAGVSAPKRQSVDFAHSRPC